MAIIKVVHTDLLERLTRMEELLTNQPYHFHPDVTELLERLSQMEERLNNQHDFSSDLDTSIPLLPSPIIPQTLSPPVPVVTSPSLPTISSTVQTNQQFPSPTCTSTQVTNHAVLTPLHEVPTSDLFTVTPNQPATQAMDTSAAFLIQMRGNSCSRGNFAANLCRQWFSLEERKSSNVCGKNGKTT